MKTRLLAVCLLASACAFSQAIRVDPTPVLTIPANAPPGVDPPVLAVPGANVHVCAFPANGVPCTNYATTYTDNTGTTPCSNATQIVLPGTSVCVPNTDARGNFGFWVGVGSLYSYTVTTPDGTSYGPFAFTPTITSTAGAITYIATGTGAVSRTVASKLGDVINAKDYGAVCNGTTDDTAAIQAAITAAGPGWTVVIPPSTNGCLISSPGLSVNNQSNVGIVGGGPGAKLLSLTITPMWSFINVAGSTSNLTVSGITFVGSATTTVSFSVTQGAVVIPSTATGSGLVFAFNNVSQTNVGVTNHANNFNDANIFGNTFSNLVDPSRTSGYADIYTIGKHWHIYANWFVNSPFQGVYLSGDLASLGGGASYCTVEDNTFINPYEIAVTTFSTSSQAPVTGNVFAHNHIFAPQNIAMSADGTATGTIIMGNDVTGATGSFGSGQGIIQSSSANTVGHGESLLIQGNTIKNSSGTIPPIWVTDNNHLTVQGNILLNNPGATAGMLITTIEGGTVVSGDLITGNTISGGSSVSIQGPGTGAITNSVFSDNAVDGTIINIDATLSAHNIVAGNGGAGNSNWASANPVSVGSSTAAKSTLDVFGNLSGGSYAGATAAPTNGFIYSGVSGIGTSSPVSTAQLTIVGPTSGLPTNVILGDPTVTDAAGIEYRTISSQYNWKAGAQILTNGKFEFIPSTAIGGTTYTTPVVQIDHTGLVNALAGYSVNSVSGFSGTKTAGSCVLTISGGIITNVTGC